MTPKRLKRVPGFHCPLSQERDLLLPEHLPDLNRLPAALATAALHQEGGETGACPVHWDSFSVSALWCKSQPPVLAYGSLLSLTKRNGANAA